MPGPALISVIVPVRDRRDLLVLCLDGLGAQTYPRFEVVVVDDGSTDGSDREARAHPCSGHPVRVVASATPGGGAVAARITGVAHAAGDVLAFTDSDCVPAPTWLEELVRAIDDGADVVQGRTEPARQPAVLERSVWGLRDDGLYATCNVAYRRPAYEKAGGFDEGAADRLRFRLGRRAKGLGFGEDTILGWRVRRDGTSVFRDGALVRHHVFPYDRGEMFSRSLQAGAFPALVREVPELRGTLLRHRIFLGTARVPLYVGAVLLLAGRRGVALAATAVWVGGRWRQLRGEPDRGRRLQALATLCQVDVLEAAVLVVGSIASRTPVL